MSDSATPWTAACQDPLSLGFSRQKYWSRLLFPSPGYLPDPGIEPMSPALTGGFFTTARPGKPFLRLKPTKISSNMKLADHKELQGDWQSNNHKFVLGTIWCILLLLTAKLLQSCLTLCSRIDGSPSGSPIPGTLQARTLEWVAISFSNAWKWKVKVKSLSRVCLLATPWTVAHQVPPSMGFSRPEY